MSKPQLKLASKPAKPREWPFPSRDTRVNEQAQADMPEQDQGEQVFFCQCENELTLGEIDSGRCASCGKSVFA